MNRRFHPTERWKRAIEQAPSDVRQVVATILARIVEEHPVGPQQVGDYTASEGRVVVAYRVLADHPLVILLDVIWLE